MVDLKASPYLLVSPYFILFLIFGAFPLGFTLWVSLHDWQLAGDKEWIGFDNYQFLLTNERFRMTVVNTIGMFIIATLVLAEFGSTIVSPDDFTILAPRPVS